MITVLIVDDEPLAHQVLLHHCAAWPDLVVAGHCYSAAEALAFLLKQPVDLLLLDIRMPVLSGLDMLKVLAHAPQVIITSAHQEYALDGFNLDVTDYLLKPVSAERFAQALDKVRRRHAGAGADAAPMAAAAYLALKVERELRKFTLADISCFEAYGNYVKVWQGQQMVLVNATLKQIREQVPPMQFVQVHKSFLVNRQHVSALDSQLVHLSNNMRIRIGDAYKGNARAIL
ncbi:MAG: Transcriptional regulatory protein YehT [Pseudomonadota bacterium]|jgi:DNA-binding LytR/AlgR family response regulator